MVIFHSYVKLPEGIFSTFLNQMLLFGLACKGFRTPSQVVDFDPQHGFA
jgi:hypothetical protein